MQYEKSILVFGISALSIIAAGCASTPSNEEKQSAGEVAKEEASGEQFSPTQFANEMVINTIHHVNQHEIDIAKLAQKKAESPEAKNTAQQLLKDHQQLETQVEQVAKAQGIKLEKYSPATFEKAAKSRLESLEKAQFDHAFLLMMQEGHKMVAADLRSVRPQIQDQQVGALIESALPKIVQHAQIAGQAHAKVMEKSSGQAGAASPESEHYEEGHVQQQ